MGFEAPLCGVPMLSHAEGGGSTWLHFSERPDEFVDVYLHQLPFLLRSHYGIDSVNIMICY